VWPSALSCWPHWQGSAARIWPATLRAWLPGTNGRPSSLSAKLNGGAGTLRPKAEGPLALSAITVADRVSSDLLVSGSGTKSRSSAMNLARPAGFEPRPAA
jgi:hypothetical protein